VVSKFKSSTRETGTSQEDGTFAHRFAEFQVLPRLWGKNGLVFEYAGTLGRAPPLGGHLPRADDDHIMFPSESG
jgi:hypothetical protein